MLTILKLEKDDICTFKCGFNFAIRTKEGTEIILSREAVDELYADLTKYKTEPEVTAPGD